MSLPAKVVLRSAIYLLLAFQILGLAFSIPIIAFRLAPERGAQMWNMGLLMTSVPMMLVGLILGAVYYKMSARLHTLERVLVSFTSPLGFLLYLSMFVIGALE